MSQKGSEKWFYTYTKNYNKVGTRKSFVKWYTLKNHVNIIWCTKSNFISDRYHLLHMFWNQVGMLMLT